MTTTGAPEKRLIFGIDFGTTYGVCLFTAFQRVSADLKKLSVIRVFRTRGQ